MPDYRDSDLLALYRSGAMDDLRFTATSDCACHDEAWRRASATQRPEYGQVFPNEVTACRKPEKWCDGRVVLSCSNTASLFDALDDAGFATFAAKDAELLRRFELAERAQEAQAKVLDFALGALGLEPAPDTTEAELQASRILIDAGHSPAAVARAGRALRNLK